MAERGSKLGGVVAFLEAAIAGGRFAPGQRLVEAELTAELGISRSLLREALRDLSAKGAIEMVANRGALVRRLSLAEALELFQIRAELEALAGRLAAGRMADRDVRAAFEAAVAPMLDTGARPSVRGYIAENRRFHDAIFAAAGNGQLARLNCQMQLPLIMAQIGAALSGEAMALSVAEHREIARAILAGEAEEAAGLLRAHLARAACYMAEMPPELFRDA